jgi:hypothetical protein
MPRLLRVRADCYRIKLLKNDSSEKLILYTQIGQIGVKRTKFFLLFKNVNMTQ